ncbi:IS701 family transposase [Streptomyces sp. 6N223]|uniref:IS701 family transposase n=1 Tax=Streptomyces sp. 6N223 TaxID=3457412 RepID=UPI003FD13B91
MNALDTPLPTLRSNAASDLIATVFAPLRRSDQRRRATQYVQGLLGTQGRKSIRRIAGVTRDSAAEQSLQHFVSSSPWEWDEIRAALARRIEEAIRPAAWVVRPMVIPKAGSLSVGVARRYIPDLDQAINCQEAYGVWLASEQTSAPVHWRLQLPGEWLEDPERRRGVGIPDTALAESPLRSAVGAAVEMETGGWGLARRPVVLDCGADPDSTAAAALAAAGLPFIARICAGAKVMATAGRAAVPGAGRGLVAAQQLIAAVRWKRHPVKWLDPESGLLRTSLAAKLNFPTPMASLRTQPRPVALLVEWDNAGDEPSGFWLTDLADAPAGTLLRLTKLTRRADRDFADITDRVGIRDFEGRSYPGWHRHATLASVAHAAAILPHVPDAVGTESPRLLDPPVLARRHPHPPAAPRKRKPAARCATAAP